MGNYRQSNSSAFDDKKHIQSLIDQREKNLTAVYKESRAYLMSQKFYEKTLNEKVEFLGSGDALVLIENMYGNKMSIIMIADCLGVTQNEFYEIMRENPKVFDAIERGRSKQIDEVEETLYQVANGFYKEETKEKLFYNDRTDREAKQVETYKRFYPPNFYAQQYLLNNKREKEYRDKQIEMEIAKNTIKIELVTIGDDTLNLE